jgi:hypothetical protein
MRCSFIHSILGEICIDLNQQKDTFNLSSTKLFPPHNRALSRCSGRNLGARDLLPSLKSLVTGDPVLSGFQTMTARAEEIVDAGMNREKALGLAD